MISYSNKYNRKDDSKPTRLTIIRLRFTHSSSGVTCDVSHSSKSDIGSWLDDSCYALFGGLVASSRATQNRGCSQPANTQFVCDYDWWKGSSTLSLADFQLPFHFWHLLQLWNYQPSHIFSHTFGSDGGGCFHACEHFGRMIENLFPACAFFFFFFSVESSSGTLIPLFRPGSVHSGLASCDDCGRVINRFLIVPTLCLDSGIVSPIRLRWVNGACVFGCNLSPALFKE